MALAIAFVMGAANDAVAQGRGGGADTTGRGRGGGAVDTTAGRRGGGGGGGGQRGGGRGGIRMMTLTVPWIAGGTIPLKYTQGGAEVSPALKWSGAPDSTKSFVLFVTNMSVAAVGGVDGPLHWLVWNIPGTATGLKENIPHGPTLPDGTQQISLSGPYYRGPAAPATSLPHTYMFELMALDTVLTIPSTNVAPGPTRAAIVAAIAGRVRGKAYAFGTWAYPKPVVVPAAAGRRGGGG
jgi:Raf kinase inhibitor-like YbhB/YbcL family protein